MYHETKRSIDLGFGPAPASRALFMVMVPAACILCLAAVAGTAADTTMDLLVRDVAGIAGINPFYGALSQLGLAVWGMSIGVACLASGLLLRMQRPRSAMFMLSAALLTGLALIDD